MTRIPRIAVAVLTMASTCVFAATPKPPPAAPPEVMAAAPAGTKIVAFASSGSQADADAAAVFEGAPDKDDVRHRTLVVFGKKGGAFAADFSSDKLIGCSKCTQFHDDPFWPDGVKVTAGHIVIDQSDSGEMPSETSLGLVRRDGIWRVERADRSTVVGGRGSATLEHLARPASGLAKDLDAKWSVPVFYNSIVVNDKTGRFIFLLGTSTKEGVWDSVKGRCDQQNCSILVQQQDGCIALVQDAAAKSFGAGTPDYRNKAAAPSMAMASCQAAGGQQCKVVREDCTQGI